MSGKRHSAHKATFESGNTLVLSKADSVSFFETLENPPEPNNALKNAVRLYRESVSSDEDRIFIQST
ncbi:MAG: DUF1778 domain-containing protein [Desulfococcaceae bacterium]